MCVLLLLGAAVTWSFRTVPLRNNDDPRVDALLVLGSPAELDGSVTQAQRWRVDEAVREWKRGRAPRILFSGGAAANRFVEADVMALYAEKLGVPRENAFEERASKTTLANVQDSERLLTVHGWRRVEVVSSAEHLPRAALLLEHTSLLWRMHAAPTPGRSRMQLAGAYAEEAVGAAAIRVFGPRAEPVLHGVAVLQHGAAFAVRWVVYKVEGWFGHLALAT